MAFRAPSIPDTLCYYSRKQRGSLDMQIEFSLSPGVDLANSGLANLTSQDKPLSLVFIHYQNIAI